MNISPISLAAAGLAAVLALPLLGLAAEPNNYDADARYAENAPPVISHRIADDANGEACLACHKAGLNGAPLSPHPVRLNCTQCHVRSDTTPTPLQVMKSKAKK